MSLLDSIDSARGSSQIPFLNAGGRHLCRVKRAYLREADPVNNIKSGGGFDVEMVHSFAPNAELQPDLMKGSMLRCNDAFKYPAEGLARIRRGIAASLTAKSGKPVNETTLGLTKNAGETDESFKARVKAEFVKALGEEQSCRDALVTVNVTVRTNKTTGAPYSLFEVMVPTEADLNAAGI